MFEALQHICRDVWQAEGFNVGIFGGDYGKIAWKGLKHRKPIMLFSETKLKHNLIGRMFNDINHWRFDPAKIIASGEVAVIRCHWHVGRFPDPARQNKKKSKYECDQPKQDLLMSSTTAHESNWTRHSQEKRFGSVNMSNSTFPRARGSNMMIQDLPGSDSSLDAVGKEVVGNYDRFTAVFNLSDPTTFRTPPGEWADPRLGLKRGIKSWKEHNKKICTVKEEPSEEASSSSHAPAAGIGPSPAPDPSCPRRSLPSEPAPEAVSYTHLTLPTILLV